MYFFMREYANRNIENIISSLEEIQKAGVSLAEATKSLHMKENIPFDDIWPAIIQLLQLSEKEAMRTTKEWCLHCDNSTNK